MDEINQLDNLTFEVQGADWLSGDNGTQLYYQSMVNGYDVQLIRNKNEMVWKAVVMGANFYIQELPFSSDNVNVVAEKVAQWLK